NGNSIVVNYTAPTATDLCEGSPPVLCQPASGASFAVGTNTVNCFAADSSGNSSSCSFALSVVRRLVVLNTNDSGSGSLRQTITDANSTPGPDTITFLIDGSAPHTIAPLSQLPEITAPVIINGWSQPGFAGKPIIEIDGRFVNNVV